MPFYDGPPPYIFSLFCIIFVLFWERKNVWGRYITNVTVWKILLRIPSFWSQTTPYQVSRPDSLWFLRFLGCKLMPSKPGCTHIASSKSSFWRYRGLLKASMASKIETDAPPRHLKILLMRLAVWKIKIDAVDRHRCPKTTKWKA